MEDLAQIINETEQECQKPSILCKQKDWLNYTAGKSYCLMLKI